MAEAQNTTLGLPWDVNVTAGASRSRGDVELGFVPWHAQLHSTQPVRIRK